MQLYEERNGQYTEEESNRMLKNDRVALYVYQILGEKAPWPFHFPIQNVHDEEYCRDFLNAIKGSIKALICRKSKIDYLLPFKEKDDKSVFLNRLGYTRLNSEKLFDEIFKGVQIDSLKYVRFSFGCFMCKAKTRIQGKLVTTVWVLEKNLTLRFVTLIPRGDKTWKE